MTWLTRAHRPPRSGVFATLRADGLKLFRRWDGRRWYYGDPFRSNAGGVMQPVPSHLLPQLVVSWDNDEPETRHAPQQPDRRLASGTHGRPGPTGRSDHPLIATTSASA